MKSKLHSSLIVLAWLALFTLNFELSNARAQGTAFTYSGQLQDNGSPANGAYDMTFTLFNNSARGVSIAGPITNNGVVVNNGLFTVLIDFGTGVFTGQIDWLQIGVASNGASSFAALSPRQQLTPTPYALFASNAAVALTATNASSALFAGSATTAAFFSGALSGDVTGTQSATVVSSVGGQTAGNVAAGVAAANAAASTNTPGTIVQRDSSGSFSAGTITLVSNLNLPYIVNRPAVIYSGPYDSLMYADSNWNFFSGLNAGNSDVPMTGQYNTASGFLVFFQNTTGSWNTVCGAAAAQNNSTGSYNTVMGGVALRHNTSGSENTATGYGALYDNTNGSFNTATGYAALYDNTSGIDNTAMGADALASNTVGSFNTADGLQALYVNTSGSGNTANGISALHFNTTGSNNTAMGSYALLNSTNDSGLVAVGFQALQNDNAVGNTNTADGNGHNTAIGYQALQANTLGAANTAIGYQALLQNTGGIQNTAIGDHALLNNASGNWNTAMGVNALNANKSGIYNTANGVSALYANTSGSFNTATGNGALYHNTGGSYNTANGEGALASTTDGSNNVAIGAYALNYNDAGSNNTANGVYALYYTAGNDNTGEGMNALGQLLSGDNNIALGYNAGGNISSGNNNIDIGNAGLAMEDGVIRIGTQGVQTATYLTGTVYADGVQLTSDRNAKENFTAVNARDVLAKVAALPVTQWNYKKESKDVQHIGPMAQDFQAAFQLSADDKHISVVDEGGVALAAIQGLNQEVQERETRIEHQATEIQNLKQQNDSLARRLNELEATVKQLLARK